MPSFEKELIAVKAKTKADLRELEKFCEEARKQNLLDIAREKAARRRFDEMVTEITNSWEYKDAVAHGATPFPLEKYRKAPFAVSTAGPQQGPATRKKEADRQEVHGANASAAGRQKVARQDNNTPEYQSLMAHKANWERELSAARVVGNKLQQQWKLVLLRVRR